MRYVFFDIECACVYKNIAKICVFGYCEADEQFNILKKEDILINPNGKFHLTDHDGDGIVLPYDYASFSSLPTFPHFYPRIKELLEGEDVMVVGHATINDVKYLNLETRRYKLQPLTFSYADTQILYMGMTEIFDRQVGLETLMKELNIEYTPHRAADDAYATLRIAQEMCRKEGMTFTELLKKYGIRLGRTQNGQFTGCGCERKAQYVARQRKAKLERSEKRSKFNDFVYGYRAKPQTNEFKGKRFSFSMSIEENLPLSKSLVKELVRRGGKYSLRLSGCNVYVEEDSDDSARKNNAVKLLETGQITEIYTLSAFRELLGMQSE